MKHTIAQILFCLFATTAGVHATNSPAVIPLPAKMEVESGKFRIRPQTRIIVDSVAQESGQYLARQLGKSTGRKFSVVLSSESSPAKGDIWLTTENARGGLGSEGYSLTATPVSVTIRASESAGLFYGVQTLLELLPPEALASKIVTGVDWTVPCVQIEDQPRFKWRGLMLDVSRHFLTKEEVERMLDLMALRKLNVLHWHLVDDQGWRIEIKKYPRLTQIGAWRKGIGFGLDPKDSTAYGTDGRYGGYYTQDDIREVVAYAGNRHIMIVPEIEMPGHSSAALKAYPEYSCTGGSFNTDSDGGIFNGIYCAGNEATFQFLEDILTEVFQLFPSPYIHVGGDEVMKDTWEHCPKCQARIKDEGLKNEEELQSYFIRRIDKFINAHGRKLIGWSEILQGGLNQNATVMAWLGGAVPAASSGHDVVMSPLKYCYFCYYPSLDRPPHLRAYRPYLPLRQTYEFDPIPADLEPQYQSHILGAEGCIWTVDIPSLHGIEEMTFPRLSALSEVVWSPKSARNWDDFTRRLNFEYHRLDQENVNYWRDRAEKIGEWKPAQITSQGCLLEWDATQNIAAPGRQRVSMNYIKGENGLDIEWVALLQDGHEIARDTHPGFTGTTSRETKAHDWNYFIDLPGFRKGARYTIQSFVSGDKGNNSAGVVFLESESQHQASSVRILKPHGAKTFYQE